jgi:hypothetical protein
MTSFPLWKEILIPTHTGGDDLIGKIQKSGMHIEYWAEQLLRAAHIAPRTAAITCRIARISSKQLGLTTPTVAIAATKKAGQAHGLQLLTMEEVLALRLSYIDQPREWMRIAAATHVDKDGSWLDLALVNDGVRRDIRTTWAFEQNVYQPEHEWFWVTSKN